MARALLFLYAESPVHAGGDTSRAGLDEPVQREAHTRLPVIWGQSLKGALRAHARAAGWEAKSLLYEVFGDKPPAGAGQNHAKPGSLSVGDAQLVAFPAPTLVNTYAWLASPVTLGRLRRKVDLTDWPAPDLPRPPADAPTVDMREACAASPVWEGDRVVLGPFVTASRADTATADWARWLADATLPPAVPGFFRTKLTSDLVTVIDDVLRQVTIECAEITARVQLKPDEKTVAQGPFESEYLPTETILAALLECGSTTHLGALRTLLDGQILRLGGDETIGKGLLWCRFLGADGAGQGDTPEGVDDAAQD
jgi:CRISPR-associated protein Cmr4